MRTDYLIKARCYQARAHSLQGVVTTSPLFGLAWVPGSFCFLQRCWSQWQIQHTGVDETSIFHDSE